jgi:hypothetical protein
VPRDAVRGGMDVNETELAWRRGVTMGALQGQGQGHQTARDTKTVAMVAHAGDCLRPMAARNQCRG